MRKGQLNTRNGIKFSTQSLSLEDRLAILEKNIENIELDQNTIDITKTFGKNTTTKLNTSNMSYSFKIKEHPWSGINVYGLGVWSDGKNIYYSNSSSQYVLDKETSIWNQKTWKGLTSFYGQDVWSDGENIYYSNEGVQKVLVKNSDTWNDKTWNGYTKPYGRCIWTDGNNIYTSFGGSQYVLDKTTSTWNKKIWKGVSWFYGDHIWQVNGKIFLDFGYTLDGDNFKSFNMTLYEGMSSDYPYIWTNGKDYFYSDNSLHCILDKTTFTWYKINWNDLKYFESDDIWTDGENIYCSNGSIQYIFIFKPLLETTKLK